MESKFKCLPQQMDRPGVCILGEKPGAWIGLESMSMGATQMPGTSGVGQSSGSIKASLVLGWAMSLGLWEPTEALS